MEICNIYIELFTYTYKLCICIVDPRDIYMVCTGSDSVKGLTDRLHPRIISHVYNKIERALYKALAIENLKNIGPYKL